MKKRRFETRESIVSAIDKVNALFTRRSLEASQHGGKADALFSQSAKEITPQAVGALVKEAQYERSLERKLVRKNRSVPKRLEALKNTLVAFDTEIVAFETSRAVVLQK